MVSNAKSRNGEIDVLRFLFAVGICFYHWNCNYNLGFFKYGNIGVDFFFLVSGYLMAKQVQNLPELPGNSEELTATAWRLVMRRIKHFYPYYLCAFAVSTVVYYGVLSHSSLRDLVIALLRSTPTLTLTFQALNQNSMSLYVAETWYLSALVIGMLILFPILLKSPNFAGKVLCPLFFLFCIGYNYNSGGYSLGAYNNWTGLCFAGVLKAVGELSLGIALVSLEGALADKLQAIRQNPTGRLLATGFKLFCYTIVFACAYGANFGSGFNLHAMLLAAIGILLSFNSVGYTIPNCVLTRYLGKASLGIYVFHGLIRMSVKLVVPDIGGSARKFFAFAVGSILISLILMHTTDLLKKLFSPRKAIS